MKAARDAGLSDPRVTSDVKHVEIGLTDKSDSARWLFAELHRRGIGPHAVLVGGDEFGAIAGLPGSDSLMLVEAATASTKVSVGIEPGGLPPGVIGARRWTRCLRRSSRRPVRRRERGELPLVDPDPEWTLAIEGFDPTVERARASLLTLADGCIGTSGLGVARPWRHASARPDRRHLRRARVPRAAFSRGRCGRRSWAGERPTGRSAACSTCAPAFSSRSCRSQTVDY